VERVFGFDKLNAWHRKIGYSLTASILLHPILLVVGYAGEHGVSYSAQFADFFNNWHDVSKAMLGILILLSVGIFSIRFFRKRMRYEHWHLVHLLMYLSVGFAFGHQTNFASVSAGWPMYYWLALNFCVFGCLLFYRFINPFVQFARFRFVVERVVPEGGDVYSIYVGGRGMERFKYEAGQFLHVYFLQKGLWQPHPFSISNAQNGKYLRISAKSLGDYTAKLRDLKSGTSVILEGPFGRFTEVSAKAKESKFLFLAGGIGITPIRAMAENLAKTNGDFVLLYAARTEKDLILKDELSKFGGRQHYVLSDEKSTQNPNTEIGRIDDEKILRLAPDVRERDVYVCGPPPMMDALVILLKKLGVPEPQIHFERFSY
jgi:predicted ferric reductase